MHETSESDFDDPHYASTSKTKKRSKIIELKNLETNGSTFQS